MVVVADLLLKMPDSLPQFPGLCRLFSESVELTRREGPTVEGREKRERERLKRREISEK